MRQSAAGELDAGLRNRIKRDYPQSKPTDYICGHHLLKYRLEHVDALINADMKQTKKINQKLTKALQSDDYDIIDVNDSLSESLTFGQKVSDDVARFGGSWGFIFVFMFVLIGWMIVNGLHLFGVNFDNYPFILLNLVLLRGGNSGTHHHDEPEPFGGPGPHDGRKRLPC